jgi:hypothetical protein
MLVAGGCTPKPGQSMNAPGNASMTGPSSSKSSPRISVQHGYDADAAKVDPSPKTITIEALLATRNLSNRKIDLAQYKNRRAAPFETTTFAVTGSIKSIKHEKDGDYYMVIKGKSGAEAIVEVPDPSLCKGSPLLSEIKAARASLEKRYHPTDEVQSLNEEITVDGVGFLGSRRKPGSGSFGSSVRLMPGTGVKFSG